MLFDVFVTLKGPGGTKEVPNSGNPIHSNTLQQLLEKLEFIDLSRLGVVYIGIRVVLHAS
jgi:hypothetical protein